MTQKLPGSWQATNLPRPFLLRGVDGLGNLHWVTSLLLGMMDAQAPVRELPPGAQSASRSRFLRHSPSRFHVFMPFCGVARWPTSLDRNRGSLVEKRPVPAGAPTSSPVHSFPNHDAGSQASAVHLAVYPRVYPGGFTGCRAVPRRAWFSSPAKPLRNRVFQHFCRAVPRYAR